MNSLKLDHAATPSCGTDAGQADTTQTSGRIPLLYALHSGNLYGTEKMALVTMEGLRDQYQPVLFTPPGPVVAQAQRRGFIVQTFTSAKAFAKVLQPWMARHKDVVFFATGIVHSFGCLAWQALYGNRVKHIHMVHGGTDERLSYGRKKILNHFPVTFVAVSDFVRQRLLAHRVADRKIRVIENFLADGDIAAAPRRAPFDRDGVRKVIVVSRIDPIKRIDVLLDALQTHPELSALQVNIFGTGWSLDEFRARAAAKLPQVQFLGYRSDVPEQIAQHDALIHLCPEEPFGLAVLEAYTAGIPVVVPNSGGAGSLVIDGVSGYHFAANDPQRLAVALNTLMRAKADDLNRQVAGGRELLATRFSQSQRLGDYRQLVAG